jgi:nucleoid DNA-binding protein
MTRQEIVKNLTQFGLTKKQSFAAVTAFFHAITTALQEGKKVSIVGFGSWEWRQRSPRLSLNPKTGRTVSLGHRKVLVFRPSRIIKKRIRS